MILEYSSEIIIFLLGQASIITYYIVTSNLSDRKSKRQVSESITNELVRTKTRLNTNINNSKNEIIKISAYKESLDHDFFDASLFTGNIFLMNIKFQQKTQKYYSLVKKHNAKLERLFNHMDNFKITDDENIDKKLLALIIATDQDLKIIQDEIIKQATKIIDDLK